MKATRFNRIFPLCFLCALLFNFCASAQPVISTTAYTRGLLIQATAAACRAYLGITNGQSYSIIVDTNGFGVNFDTTVFFMQGSTNLTVQGAPATAGFLPLTNVILNANTRTPVIALGNAGGTLTVDPSLSDEFSLTLTNDLTLGFTLSSWSDGHNVRLRVANTGSFSVTFTNVAYWYPHGNSSQITNDWGAGIHNSFAFWKDAGSIYASDKEGIGTATGGSGTTVNPTIGRVPYKSAATTFGDSPWHVIAGDTNTLGFNSTNFFVRNDPSKSNTALGDQALAGVTSGQLNTALGVGALGTVATGNSSTAIGYHALTSSTAGTATAVGAFALAANTSGAPNTAAGYQALFSNTTGGANTAMGYGALLSNVSGAQNTAVGNSALRNSTANSNTGMGSGAGGALTSGGNNTALGDGALQQTTTGDHNTTVGNQSGYGLQAASANNTLIGALIQNQDATNTDNTIVGAYAGGALKGNKNTIMGSLSAQNTNNQNVVTIGYAAGLSENATNQIAIGYQTAGHGNNTATIGDANVTALYLGNTLLGSANQTPAASVYFGGQYSFSGGSGGIQPTNIRSGNLAAGSTDLYTVPASQRLMVAFCSVGSTNTTSTTTFLQLKTNGVYYRYSANHNVSVALVQVTVDTLNDPFLFEPGETIALSNSLAGVNVVISGFLISTNSNCYSPRILSLGAGNNTLYTCPAGKCAVAMPLPLSAVGVNPVYINDSGGTRTLFFYVVPSGSTPLLSNAQYVGATVTDKNRLALNGNVLFPGDSLVFSSDATTATQWARCTVAEIPFP